MEPFGVADDSDEQVNHSSESSILDVPVSLFRSVFEKEPTRTIQLLDFLTTNDHRPQVERLRKAKEKEEQTRLKKQLPQITPSGTFRVRADQEIIEHSGLLCLDIDRKDNEHLSNFDNLKEEISKIEQVAYCGLSASGKGFFILVPIAYPEQHRAQYQAFKTFIERFGLVVDNTPDRSRLRAASYDPEPYIQHDAELFRGVPKPRFERKKKKRIPQKDDIETLEAIVREIERKGTDITSSYEAWHQIAAAIANVAGAEGEELFQRISQFHPDYNEKESSKKFKDRLRSSGGYGLGTVVYFSKIHGFLE